MLTVGSLFAGIGGFDLGLERAGMRTLWQVELDPQARMVLAEHFPNADRYEDVRDMGSHNLAPVDVICGGFPCQDISTAGPGTGIAGPRSGLWSEYARIVGELRPRYVLVENVAALLVRGLGTVLGDLAALGYDAEWDCIPAAAVGAHHLRDRLWLVAYPADGLRRPDRRGLGSGEGTREGQARCGPVRQGNWGTRNDGLAARGADVSDAESERCGPGRQGRPAGDRQRAAEQSYGAAAYPYGLPPFGTPVAWRERGPWRIEPDVGRVAHGVPARLDRLRLLGNALVPQVAEWLGRRILSYEGGVT